MATAVKKTVETNYWTNKEHVDYSHLSGYKEMSIKEINRVNYTEGGADYKPEVHIVFQDEVGNNRVGKIDLKTLRETVDNIDIHMSDEC